MRLRRLQGKYKSCLSNIQSVDSLAAAKYITRALMHQVQTCTKGPCFCTKWDPAQMTAVFQNICYKKTQSHVNVEGYTTLHFTVLMGKSRN